MIQNCRPTDARTEDDQKEQYLFRADQDEKDGQVIIRENNHMDCLYGEYLDDDDEDYEGEGNPLQAVYRMRTLDEKSFEVRASRMMKEFQRWTKDQPSVREKHDDNMRLKNDDESNGKAFTASQFSFKQTPVASLNYMRHIRNVREKDKLKSEPKNSYHSHEQDLQTSLPELPSTSKNMKAIEQKHPHISIDQVQITKHKFRMKSFAERKRLGQLVIEKTRKQQQKYQSIDSSKSPKNPKNTSSENAYGYGMPIATSNVLNRSINQDEKRSPLAKSSSLRRFNKLSDLFHSPTPKSNNKPALNQKNTTRIGSKEGPMTSKFDSNQNSRTAPPLFQNQIVNQSLPALATLQPLTEGLPHNESAKKAYGGVSTESYLDNSAEGRSAIAAMFSSDDPQSTDNNNNNQKTDEQVLPVLAKPFSSTIVQGASNNVSSVKQKQTRARDRKDQLQKSPLSYKEEDKSVQYATSQDLGRKQQRYGQIPDSGGQSQSELSKEHKDSSERIGPSKDGDRSSGVGNGQMALIKSIEEQFEKELKYREEQARVGKSEREIQDSVQKGAHLEEVEESILVELALDHIKGHRKTITEARTSIAGVQYGGDETAGQHLNILNQIEQDRVDTEPALNMSISSNNQDKTNINLLFNSNNTRALRLPKFKSTGSDSPYLVSPSKMFPSSISIKQKSNRALKNANKVRRTRRQQLTQGNGVEQMTSYDSRFSQIRKKAQKEHLTSLQRIVETAQRQCPDTSLPTLKPTALQSQSISQHLLTPYQPVAAEKQEEETLHVSEVNLQNNGNKHLQENLSSNTTLLQNVETKTEDNIKMSPSDIDLTKQGQNNQTLYRKTAKKRMLDDLPTALNNDSSRESFIEQHKSLEIESSTYNLLEQKQENIVDKEKAQAKDNNKSIDKVNGNHGVTFDSTEKLNLSSRRRMHVSVSPRDRHFVQPASDDNSATPGGYEEVYETSPIRPCVVYGGEHSLKEPRLNPQEITANKNQSLALYQNASKISQANTKYLNQMIVSKPRDSSNLMVQKTEDDRVVHPNGKFVSAFNVQDDQSTEQMLRRSSLFTKGDRSSIELKKFEGEIRAMRDSVSSHGLSSFAHGNQKTKKYSMFKSLNSNSMNFPQSISVAQNESPFNPPPQYQSRIKNEGKLQKNELIRAQNLKFRASLSQLGTKSKNQSGNMSTGTALNTHESVSIPSIKNQHRRGSNSVVRNLVIAGQQAKEMAPAKTILASRASQGPAQELGINRNFNLVPMTESRLNAITGTSNLQFGGKLQKNSTVVKRKVNQIKSQLERISQTNASAHGQPQIIHKYLTTSAESIHSIHSPK